MAETNTPADKNGSKPEVVDDENRREDERDHTPPAERHVDRRVFPERGIDAPLTEVARRAVVEPHDQEADVLMERDVARRGFAAAAFAIHNAGPNDSKEPGEVQAKLVSQRSMSNFAFQIAG